MQCPLANCLILGGELADEEDNDEGGESEIGGDEDPLLDHAEAENLQLV